jgi:hypothetical protein
MMVANDCEMMAKMEMVVKNVKMMVKLRRK